MGVEVWPEGTRYEGNFVSSLKNGKGQLTFVDGAVYKGMFKDNEMHGYGIYKWPDER